MKVLCRRQMMHEFCFGVDKSKQPRFSTAIIIVVVDKKNQKFHWLEVGFFISIKETHTQTSTVHPSPKQTLQLPCQCLLQATHYKLYMKSSKSTDHATRAQSYN